VFPIPAARCALLAKPRSAARNREGRVRLTRMTYRNASQQDRSPNAM
jgi:hypothetical protein